MKNLISRNAGRTVEEEVVPFYEPPRMGTIIYNTLNVNGAPLLSKTKKKGLGFFGWLGLLIWITVALFAFSAHSQNLPPAPQERAQQPKEKETPPPAWWPAQPAQGGVNCRWIGRTWSCQ